MTEPLPTDIMKNFEELFASFFGAGKIGGRVLGLEVHRAYLVALHERLLNDEPAESLEDAMCEALHALVDVTCAPRGESSARPGRFSAAVVRARALLDERFTETIGLEELALHARLDKFRLCRAFRDEVGLPPHAYVTHRRVARAQDLLAQRVPQAEVAARVGFYDQSLMHRHFKQIVRLTPGAWAHAAAR